MEDNWGNPYEEDGVTLGPEEALLRETEKTKALKVEKLQLKGTIEKLQSKNDTLVNVNNSLEQKLISLTEQSSSSIHLETDQTHTLKWAYLLLIFNLTALIILILFHIKQEKIPILLHPQSHLMWNSPQSKYRIKDIGRNINLSVHCIHRT